MYFPDRHWAHISKDAIRLVLAMTNPNPFKRITAEEAMEHPWFQHDWE
jgi:serine/threonine protein kinase